MPLPGLRGIIGGKPKAQLSYRGGLTLYTADDTGDSNPIAMGNISLGVADTRRLVVVTGGFGRNSDHSGTPSVTVGGVLLTQDAYSGGGQHIITGVWSGVVPTGDLSAVVLQWTTSLHQTAVLNVFVLLGLDFLVRQAQYGTKFPAGSTASNTIQALLSSTANQFMLVAAANDSGSITTTYPAGFVEDWDAFDTQSQMFTAGHTPLGAPQSDPILTLSAPQGQRAIAAATYQ